MVRVALRASAQSHVACDARCVPLRVDVVRVGVGSAGVGVCEALVGQNQPRVAGGLVSGAVEVNLGGLKGSHWWRSERYVALVALRRSAAAADAGRKQRDRADLAGGLLSGGQVG